MRQLKFRSWNGKLMEIIDDLYWFEENHVRENGDGYGCENIIMQFTGLHDKNGKEIYEGDIISYEDDPANVVKWNHDFCCWVCWEDDKLNEEGEVFDWAQMKKIDSKHYIIHGNIYENPELLK
jgi:uncharacterized phage protein (TIGR01671 family)